MSQSESSLTQNSVQALLKRLIARHSAPNAHAIDPRERQRLYLGISNPATSAESLLQRALLELRRQAPQAAFIDLLNAWARRPNQGDILSLLARAARDQGEQDAADRLIRFGLSQAPLDSRLRIADWKRRAAEDPDFRSVLERLLPELEDADERAAALELLSESKPAQARPEPPQIDPPAAVASDDNGPDSETRGSPDWVDVLVPVYRGYRETLECLHSLIEARPANRTPHQIIVLDDASPEPELSRALRALAREECITLIRHPVNLGFIRGMNRAMRLHRERDVVWLNADTRVQDDWLDRLRAHAYRAPDIASVTPFSNHGELMTFPAPGHAYPMPTPEQQQRLDRLARTLDTGPDVELEVGCGFCLFIRREALDAVGELDELELAGGYGEDTDWCLRAKSLGRRHLGATDVFVAHRGSVSFGAEKNWRVARNNARLRRRYPTVDRDYGRYLVRDPLRPARQALQRARLADLAEWMRRAPPEPAVEDATPHPRRLQIIAPPGLHDPLLPFFVPLPAQLSHAPDLPDGLLWLTWSRNGIGLEIRLGAALPGLPLDLRYRLPDERERLEQDLSRLPLTDLVFHDLRTCPRTLLHLPARLGRPYILRSLDDSLRRPPSTLDTSADWTDFVQRAAGIDLYAAALRPELSARYPLAGFQITPLDPPNPDDWLRTALSAETWIIGDRLDGAALGERWLAFARSLEHTAAETRLILIETSPWFTQLWNTGRVLNLPRLPGFGPAELARLAGARGILSLDTDPGAGWIGPRLVHGFRLHLHAPDSPVARELGARPLPAKLFRTSSIPSSATLDPPMQPVQAIHSTPDRLLMTETTPETRAFLHVGCGSPNRKRLPAIFRDQPWREIRLDINPAVAPDIVSSSADLSALEDECVHAVWSSHNLEHLEPHDVPHALREMHRVLTPDGFALITLPDIEAVAQLVVEGRLTETAYESPLGPITALDMLFGHRGSLAAGNGYMAHRTGFDAKHLAESLLEAGFAEVRVRKGQCFDLWAYAYKTAPDAAPE